MPLVLCISVLTYRNHSCTILRFCRQEATEESYLACLSQKSQVEGSQKNRTNWLFQSWHRAQLVQKYRLKIALLWLSQARCWFTFCINRRGVTNRSSRRAMSSWYCAQMFYTAPEEIWWSQTSGVGCNGMGSTHLVPCCSTELQQPLNWYSTNIINHN